jgi:hypothetical protein
VVVVVGGGGGGGGGLEGEEPTRRNERVFDVVKPFFFPLGFLLAASFNGSAPQGPVLASSGVQRGIY